jgi:signal transduction histidine kinase
MNVSSMPSGKPLSQVPCPLSDSVVRPQTYDHLTKQLREDLRASGCPLHRLIEDRLEFEEILVDISASFANLPSQTVDAQVQNGLERLAQFLRIDRGRFAEVALDSCDLLVTHSFVAKDIQSTPSHWDAELLPWQAEQVRRGSVIKIDRFPEDLPFEATIEREHGERDGLKSLLAIPLRAGGSVSCVLIFEMFTEYRSWPDDLVRRLRLLGEIFARSLMQGKAESRSLQIREQLSRIGRVNLLGELAATIAHEISQPLCAIVSNAQAGQRTLDHDRPDQNEIKDILTDIASDGRRASDVIARIRKMLQKHSTDAVPFSLNDAVHEVLNLVHGRLVQEGVAVHMDLANDLPLVSGDLIQIQQVVLNLILNAADAMVPVDRDKRRLEIRTFADTSQFVTISVHDTGAGISPEDACSVFDALFTTKPDGLGVGLAICRTIVQAHQGKIEVESTPGAGALFLVSLPLALSWDARD